MPALTRVCAGVLLGTAAAAASAQGAAPPSALLPSLELKGPTRGDATRGLPVLVQADRVEGQPDLRLQAEGEVEFRRGSLTIGADRISYDVPQDLARALGNVVVRRDGAVYRGPELQLRVQRFEGFFLAPEFDLLRLGAGGSAERLDFIDSARAVATGATYTSCPRQGPGTPAWVLKADRVRMDFDANEGIAEGAVLRFLDVPILAAPVLSFPLTDERKSGWLPPSLNIDNRSGLEVSAPYYWNIAPNRDATITPRIITRRGVGVAGEFRYLEPSFSGQVGGEFLPGDRVADRDRYALSWRHDGVGPLGVHTVVEAQRVSDDNWWRDFPSSARAITPRLLPLRLVAERDFRWAGAEVLAYARVQQWQVLQSADAITSPYQRSPQVGLQAQGRGAGGLEWQAEAEFNRFTLADRVVGDSRSEGRRWHVQGSVALPLREPGWWVRPQIAFNTASYVTDRPMSDGRTTASRFIPTVSVDAGLELERETSLFGRALRQTLEPRLHYVNTPYRNQAGLPNFDAAPRDFNVASIFADNSFVGIDRISDSHQIAAGFTSRLLDAASGAEALRLGVVQRYLLRTQRVTADNQPLSQRFSDLLLTGGTSVIPSWSLDAALQYSTEFKRLQRGVVSARYAPGEFRTLSATYRLTRGLSEQVELGWQWPLGTGALSSPGPAGPQTTAARPMVASTGCGGRWYTVGRVNYSTQERRVTDSVLGFEYDAGCWIGRVVAERLSTGRSEATTRLLLQLELVGLSRLGSNPLKVLKDNIPGYRLLREDDARAPNPSPYD